MKRLVIIFCAMALLGSCKGSQGITRRTFAEKKGTTTDSSNTFSWDGLNFQDSANWKIEVQP